MFCTAHVPLGLTAGRSFGSCGGIATWQYGGAARGGIRRIGFCKARRLALQSLPRLLRHRVGGGRATAVGPRNVEGQQHNGAARSHFSRAPHHTARAHRVFVGIGAGRELVFCREARIRAFVCTSAHRSEDRPSRTAAEWRIARAGIRRPPATVVPRTRQMLGSVRSARFGRTGQPRNQNGHNKHAAVLRSATKKRDLLRFPRAKGVSLPRPASPSRAPASVLPLPTCPSRRCRGSGWRLRRWASAPGYPCSSTCPDDDSSGNGAHCVCVLPATTNPACAVWRGLPPGWAKPTVASDRAKPRRRSPKGSARGLRRPKGYQCRWPSAQRSVTTMRQAQGVRRMHRVQLYCIG